MVLLFSTVEAFDLVYVSIYCVVSTSREYITLGTKSSTNILDRVPSHSRLCSHSPARVYEDDPVPGLGHGTCFTELNS